MPPEVWWVKIGDFGITKRVIDGTDAAPGITMGTTGFMTPELLGFQASASLKDPYTPDLWALGEITFQLLTRESAFESMRSLAIYAQGSKDFPADALHNQRVSATGVDFISSLMIIDLRLRLTAKTAWEHDWLIESPIRYQPPVETER